MLLYPEYENPIPIDSSTTIKAAVFDFNAEKQLGNIFEQKINLHKAVGAKLFKLNFKYAISITVESGIQNGTLAFVIATTILNNVEMGIPIGAYSIWMFVTGGILMWQLGKRKDK